MFLPYRKMKMILNNGIDNVFLTTNDLHYISKIFDNCIKLITKQGNQNVWMFVIPILLEYQTIIV